MGSAKYQNDGDPRTSGPGFGVSFHDDALMEPLRWRKPHTVFVNSMSDLAHARISDWQIAKMFAVMAVAHRHQFQILTKRPCRLAKILSRSDFRKMMAQSTFFGEDGNSGDDTGDWLNDGAPWPLPSLWIGTSIESDDHCWRADALRAMPAAVRFLSVEPLLGRLPGLNLEDIDWVIVGGESGRRHRRLDLGWGPGYSRSLCYGTHSVLFQAGRGRSPEVGRTSAERPDMGRDADAAGGDRPGTT